MSEVGGAPGTEGPSEQEVREYLDRLRTAPVEEVLAELLSILLSAAQVKLGRADARLLLDALAAVAGATEGRIDGGLQEQVTTALAQLRVAQVEAERRLGGAQAPTAGREGDGGERSGGRPSSGPESSSAGTPPPPAAQRSRLWVPGA